jgi:hypothetical protein
VLKPVIPPGSVIAAAKPKHANLFLRIMDFDLLSPGTYCCERRSFEPFRRPGKSNNTGFSSFQIDPMEWQDRRATRSGRQQSRSAVQPPNRCQTRCVDIGGMRWKDFRV